MKCFVYIFFVLLIFTSCGKDDSCFSKSGKSVSKTLELSAFNVIDIPKGISVEIIESLESKIEIDSKENYLSNLNFTVLNDELIITNSISCSMLHNYEIAKIRIYTPTLRKIISRTQFKVVSVGTLHFPELFIITSVESNSASSYFDLNIDNLALQIEDNQVGFFRISGKTNWLEISLYGGNGRVEAQNLITNDCTFFHRSSNDILVSPQNKLEGSINSVGNVLVYSKPNIVDVIQKYKGKLIYK